MKLSEAKQILGSLGYSVMEPDLDRQISDTVGQLLESLESRHATHTKSYKILSEMARFNGRYIGSFAGLEDAGTVNLNVRGQEKEFGVAEALSKIENDFKSANSKGMKHKTAEILLGNFERALAAVPDTADQAYIAELNKEKDYIAQYVEAGEDIPVGGWTDAALARTTHSRDDSALSAKDIIGKIQNQITSLKKGGNNYDLIKGRIDVLMSRADELTAEEKEKVQDLYVKLDLANAEGQAKAVSSGKIAIFKPDEGVNPIRVKAKLNHNSIPFTINSDGTYTITKKITQAKELLAEYGEFITPEAPAAQQSEGVVFKFETKDDADAVVEELLPGIGVSVEQRGEFVIVNGTNAQLRRTNTELERMGIVYELADMSDIPAEEGEIEEAKRVAKRAGYKVIKENVSNESRVNNLLDVAARLTDYGSI